MGLKDRHGNGIQSGGPVNSAPLKGSFQPIAEEKCND
jgi:hypothetical protein